LNNPAQPLIARSRLVRRLQAALKIGHVFVSAPPGYGKSSLLRCWPAKSPIHSSWPSSSATLMPANCKRG
jgi:ATP/maltotriose-dependent transcriptional regulator MalT